MSVIGASKIMRTPWIAVSGGPTIGSTLEANKGLGLGFDFLRVALAFSVIAVHVPGQAHAGAELGTHRLTWFVWYCILGMFFGLSGFLITGSALRLNLRNFLINRGLRIFPALGVEIVLSAFVLGPIFTNLSPDRYFWNFHTWRYLTNVIGLVNYSLPGVFVGLPIGWVNGALWTVPYELACYAIMSALMIFGFLRRPWIVAIATAALALISIGVVAFGYHPHARLDHEGLLDYLFVGEGAKLFVYFLLGISAYLWRYKIPYSRLLFAASVTWCLLVSLAFKGIPTQPVATFLTCLPLTYIMIFIGLSPVPALPFFKTGDYSYGIYLYGWPITQMMRSILGRWGSHPAILFVATVPAITLFAAFSWHAVEKQIMKLRRKFSFVARQRLADAAPSAELAGAEFDKPAYAQDAAAIHP